RRPRSALVALCLPGGAEVCVDEGFVRLGGDLALVPADRLVVLPELAARPSQPVVERGQGGVGLQRRLIAGDGLVPLPHLVVTVGQAAQDGSPGWVRRQAYLEGGQAVIA